MCIITGAFIFAFVVGSVVNIATTLSAESNEFRNRMDQLNNYLAEYHTPLPIRTQLRAYIVYCR